MKGNRFCVDTSALLAMMQNAPGGSLIGAQLRQSVTSALSWADLLEYADTREIDVRGVRRDLETLGMTIFPFTIEDAEVMVELREATQALRLSTSDRAALALAKRLAIPLVTADRELEGLQIGIEIRVLP